MLAVNGMSYHGRAGENANSAVIVTVSPEDYGGDHPLAGVRFQRELERRAWGRGKGQDPCPAVRRLLRDRVSDHFGAVRPNMKGAYSFGNVRRIFPGELAASIQEGISRMHRKIRGFAGDDVLLSGVESRTSSLAGSRGTRRSSLPCPGSTPAARAQDTPGGITSAAMDGLKVAEALIRRFTEI